MSGPERAKWHGTTTSHFSPMGPTFLIHFSFSKKKRKEKNSCPWCERTCHMLLGHVTFLKITLFLTPLPTWTPPPFVPLSSSSPPYYFNYFFHFWFHESYSIKIHFTHQYNNIIFSLNHIPIIVVPFTFLLLLYFPIFLTFSLLFLHSSLSKYYITLFSHLTIIQSTPNHFLSYIYYLYPLFIQLKNTSKFHIIIASLR